MLIKPFISARQYLCEYTLCVHCFGVSVCLKLVGFKQYPSIHTYMCTYVHTLCANAHAHSQIQTHTHTHISYQFLLLPEKYTLCS
jgi:hypothetical protein